MADKRNDDFKKLTDEEIAASTIFSKPTIITEAPKRKGESGNVIIKTVIAAVLVVVIIVSTVLINKHFGTDNLSSTDFATSSDTSSVGDGTFSVVTNDIEKVKGVTIENEHGTLEFYSKADGENTFWYIDGVPTALTNTDATYSTVSDCADLKALIKRDFEEDFDYGFEQPTAKVTVALEGEKYIFTVGKDWENSGMQGAYLKVDGDQNVYILPNTIVECFINPKRFYLNTLVPTSIEKNDQNEEYFGTELDKFDYVEFEGSKVDGGLVRFEMYSRENSTLLYKMTKPQKMIVEGSKVSELVLMMREDIDATDVLYFSGKEPTAAVLKNYKLNKPLATIKYKVGSDEREILLSQYEDGSKFYALKINSSPAIYKISHTVFEYLQNKVYEYASSALIADGIRKTEKLTFKTQKETYAFNLATTKKKNDDGEEEEVTSVTYKTKNIEFENLSKFYTYILAIGPYVTSNSILSERPDATEQYFSVTITPDSSSKDEPLELSVFKLKNNSQRYYLELDGVPVGLCETKYADMAFSNLQNLIDGKDLKDIS